MRQNDVQKVDGFQWGKKEQNKKVYAGNKETSCMLEKQTMTNHDFENKHHELCSLALSKTTHGSYYTSPLPSQNPYFSPSKHLFCCCEIPDRPRFRAVFESTPDPTGFLRIHPLKEILVSNRKNNALHLLC